ncbi:MAG: NTP transferase domain-containing protein [Acidobacteria bacterium]|nr:NTP transferase domain-containing protein [Acidobacteriota bacterium]
MDCIILAGSGENYREVSEEDNKAFLKVGDQSILEWILLQLDRVPELDRLLLIGPKSRIETHLATDGIKTQKPLLVFEQKNDLVENILFVFRTTQKEEDPNRCVLILPSDTPLLLAEEVREFIQKSDMSRNDYHGGLTTEAALSRFYPTETKPGVKMTYFYFAEGCFRINNMHLVRPSAFQKVHFIRRTYAMRYQKKWYNILRMMANVLRMAMLIPTGPYVYFGMQLGRLGFESGWPRFGRFFQKQFPMSRIEGLISKVLGVRMSMVVTTLGGSAIDVDNENDYRAICDRFGEWRKMQEDLVKQEAHT